MISETKDEKIERLETIITYLENCVFGLKTALIEEKV